MGCDGMRVGAVLSARDQDPSQAVNSLVIGKDEGHIVLRDQNQHREDIMSISRRNAMGCISKPIFSKLDQGRRSCSGQAARIHIEKWSMAL